MFNQNHIIYFTEIEKKLFRTINKTKQNINIKQNRHLKKSWRKTIKIIVLELLSPDFRIYCKALIVKTALPQNLIYVTKWHKIEEPNMRIYIYQMFDKDSKNIHWEKIAPSTSCAGKPVSTCRRMWLDL